MQLNIILYLYLLQVPSGRRTTWTRDNAHREYTLKKKINLTDVPLVLLHYMGFPVRHNFQLILRKRSANNGCYSHIPVRISTIFSLCISISFMNR